MTGVAPYPFSLRKGYGINNQTRATVYLKHSKRRRKNEPHHLSHCWSDRRLHCQQDHATNSQQGLLLDIVVGVIGAFLAGYFISPLLGIGTINDAITIPTMLVTLLGSVVLLWIVKMIRR